jgi:phage baseplate assembly protein W
LKTLALVNGDLVATATGHATVSGTSKVRQDLSLALGEPWGTDRFHADRWGSVLMDYIGTPITDDLQFQVRSEVLRAISQYIAIQDTEIYRDQTRGTRSRYATADVVRQVTGIEVTPEMDKIRIRVDLVTQAGAEVRLNRTVVV